MFLETLPQLSSRSLRRLTEMSWVGSPSSSLPQLHFSSTLFISSPIFKQYSNNNRSAFVSFFLLCHFSIQLTILAAI